VKKKYGKKLRKVEDANGLIHIGIPRERIYIPKFIDNRDTILYNLEKEGRGAGYFQAEGHRVDRNRDKIVEEFLDHPKKPEWLLMIDSDMEHPGDLPMRLTRWEKPIVGGLYFHRGELHDPFVFKEAGTYTDKYGRDTLQWAPMRDTVFNFLEDNGIPLRDGALAVNDTKDPPLIEVDAVATGALLLHRSVLEFMDKPIFEYRQGGISEDLMFCYEAKNDYGIPIYADLSAISGHYNWVAMGQTQFRVLYKGRGLNLTTYSKAQAVDMLAGYTNITKEEALDKIEKGSAHEVAPYWEAKKPSTPEEIDAFYRDEYTGKLYLMELLHWNFTGTFDSIRRPLMDFREGNVLEIGSGIGSVSIMLALQKNDVVSVEPNDYLRNFIEYRWSWIREQLSHTHATGELFLVGDDTWKQAEDEQFGLVIALDVFEHIHEEPLKAMLKDIQRVTQIGGTLYYHANWHQQDIYPMHFDHSEKWSEWLTDAGFYQTGPLSAVRIK